MKRHEIINWLLGGDVSIQYPTHQDLVKLDRKVLIHQEKRIRSEGWRFELLKRQHPEGCRGQALIIQ